METIDLNRKRIIKIKFDFVVYFLLFKDNWINHSAITENKNKKIESKNL